MSTYGQLVGLKNQGATCYINSLIQVLFMTPEFRSIIFNWKYDKEKDGNEHLCVSLQLQKIFDLMDIAQQICEPVKLDISNLTDSFGWESNEAQQQQDVCEFSDMLFELLEGYFKGTTAEGLIKKLYGGKIKSSIKSLESSHSSTKVEYFNCLYLQLPLINCTIDYTLNDAIDDYFRENFLCGDNSYYDEQLKRKVIASQTKCITKYPKLLSIQLGRFGCSNGMKNMLPVTIPYTFHLGSNIYEIYGIIMHVGYTIMTGHYYAYIRNEAQTWFMFNDEEVIEMDPIYVQHSSEGKINEDENAYLVLYRIIKVD